MTTLIANKTIAIIGGGPGGLTLARLLQLKGANVKVYERDYSKEVRVQGATLDLHEESGLEALRRAGLMDAFKANYRPDAGKLRVVDKHANIKLDGHLDANYEDDRPEIDRGPLRDILLESLQPDTVVWDSQFVSMSYDSGWKVNFKNGSSANADIVIAADGANSKIRPYITNIAPVYSGVTIVEGNVYNSEVNAPTLHKLLKGGKVFAFGDEKSLILSSKGEGSLSFYIGYKTDESWLKDSGIDFSNKEHVFNWFKKEFASWDSVWLELFQSEDLYFVPRPQYHFPLDQSWSPLPNLTMLGDAAHRMPPYAGEGVNMAMLDAVQLSECLTGNEFSDTQSAIAHYENQMRDRASEITKVTLDNTEMLHSDDSLKKMVNMLQGFNVKENEE